MNANPNGPVSFASDGDGNAAKHAALLTRRRLSRGSMGSITAWLKSTIA